jgi:hypothetical protein
MDVKIATATSVFGSVENIEKKLDINTKPNQAANINLIAFFVEVFM